MYSGQEWSVGQKVLRVSENGSVYLVPIRMVFTDGSNWRTCQESQDREDGGITNQHTQPAGLQESLKYQKSTKYLSQLVSPSVIR